MTQITSSRKLDHIKLCSSNECESVIKTHLEDIILEKTCFPTYPFNQISLTTPFFNKTLSAPIIIGAITGGSHDVTIYNKRLALAAHETNIAMAIGSQRAGLETDNEMILESYRIVRECAPNAFIIGNIGSVQLTEYGEVLDDLLNMIKGDAINVHLNWEQELVQMEGDRDGIDLNRLKEIISNWNGITIGKQVGHGMYRKDVEMCKELGMKAVDVGGIGGTSFAGVECLRAKKKDQQSFVSLGNLLWNFGVPTAMSIWEASHCDLPIISGGGIRNGIDIVKSLSIGSIACSIARPFVEYAAIDFETCIDYINDLKHQIKTGLFLCNCKDVQSAKNIDKIYTGDLYQWIQQREKK